VGLDLVCDLGTLTAGTSLTVTIEVTPTLSGVLSNAAEVASTTEDPNILDNSTSEPTTVTDLADLTIAKTDGPDPIYVGQRLTYTVTVSNQGPSDAAGVILTDTLPVNVTYADVGTTQGTCNPPVGLDLVCDLGTLTAGTSLTVTIEVTPTSSGVLSNAAEVVSTTEDPNTGDNSTTEPTIVNDLADLTIAKTADPNPVYEGHFLTYTITVTNLGPSDAASVIITDTLPANVSVNSISFPQGSCLGTTIITCTLNVLPNGNQAVLRIVVTPNASGIFSNSTEVSSDFVDLVLENNQDSTDTDVIPNADLAVSLSDDPDPTFAGEPLTYTISVTNNGPSQALGVILTNTLPVGSELVTTTPSQGTCSGTGEIVCDIGVIDSGSIVSITIVSRPMTSGLLTNDVQVSSDTVDLVAANNTAIENTLVTAAADLAVTKVDIPDPAYAGTILRYVITVVNNGPNDAVNSVLIDNLPVNVTLDAVTPDQGTCSGTTTITCNLGTLGNGAIVNVIIDVWTLSPGTITNQANISSDTADIYPANDSVNVQTNVSAGLVNLSVTSTAVPDPATAGEPLTYYFHVTNDGPSIANQVLLTNTLSADVSLQSSDASQGSCNGPVCELGIIYFGASVDVTMTVNVLPSAPPEIPNSVEVKAAEADENIEDNTDLISTVVNSIADLGVGKSDDPDPVIAGHPITYTLMINNDGPSDARDVVIIDTLPSGVSILSTSSPDCSINPSSVTCSIDLPADESRIIRLYGEVDPSTVGPVITNQVNVSSSAFDPNVSNNSTSINTDVQTQADLSVSQTDDPDPINAQEILVYSILITNHGPSDATNLILDDTLFSGVTFVSSSPDQPICTHSNHIVHCDLGNLGVDQTTSIIITTVTNQSTTGTITNHIEVSSDAEDLFPGDNVSEETTYLPPDTTPPSVVWVAPTTFSTRYDVIGEYVMLIAEASDDIAIDYVRFFRWDAINLEFKEIGIAENAPYQWNFNTSVLNPAWNEIRVQAYDTAGNVAPTGGPVYIWLYYKPTLYLPLIFNVDFVQ
jgi:uncharacterized repeat protein (TIGR01451 family)